MVKSMATLVNNALTMQ